jgi:NAD+ synthase (glutamine-hydrolysing)
MNSNRIRVGGATVNQTPFDWSNNVNNIIAAIEAAKANHVSILCLPELSLTGYGCEDLFLSDWLSESAWRHLQTIIPHCQDITVCVGLPVRFSNITYNGVCVIQDEKILGITLKQNLARDGVHYEPRWFDAWPHDKVQEIEMHGQRVQVGDLIYESEGIRFGFEICEDAWRKSKRPGYRLKQRGVQLIMNPSASHFAMSKSKLREQEVVMEGSRLFSCAYLFVNLLGNEAGRMIYDGDIIFGQQGHLLKTNPRLSMKSYNLLACDIDFSDYKNSEKGIAPEMETNEELTQAACLGLFDYMRKSRSQGFVLSLSGGADSSMCAVLISEMIKRASAVWGWPSFAERSRLNNVYDNYPDAIRALLTCAYQGTKNSSPATLHSAKTLAESIGATFHSWTIDDEVSTYTKKIEAALDRPLTWQTDDIALQNIQARSRSPVIWLLANIKKAILITTSNRSEANVGYSTMDGDTSGSLAPIAGLDKPFVQQWLQWAEKNLGYTGLAEVNKLAPTAELRPSSQSQTDEKDLMPYRILVQIEKSAIRDRQSPTQVFYALKSTTREDPSLLKDYVRKFFRLWAASQWKRERYAPSFHLDDLNVDPRSWCRFPILSGNFKEEFDQLERA